MTKSLEVNVRSASRMSRQEKSVLVFATRSPMNDEISGEPQWLSSQNQEKQVA